MFESDEFDTRLAGLRAAMADAGADLMVVDEAELLCWLTGYMSSETMYRAALVPKEGMPWFVLRALDEEVCRRATWFEDVIGHVDAENPLEVIAGTLRDRGYGDAKIGVDTHSYCLSADLYARFRRLLPEAEWVPIPGISGRLRAIKSQAEVDVIGRAARIADETMEALRRWAKPGISSREAYARTAAELVRRGTDDGRAGIVVKGEGDSEFLHAGVSDEPLHEGDILHVELVPTVGGYGARLMRPIAIGDVGNVRRRAAERLTVLQDVQIEAMVPGAEAQAIDSLLRDAILAEGLRDRYDNTSGYTLGLYGWTPRISDFTYNFHAAANWTLQAGMVFHMVLSAQGMGFSETIAVTDRGPRHLTMTPRAILQAGAAPG